MIPQPSINTTIGATSHNVPHRGSLRCVHLNRDRTLSSTSTSTRSTTKHNSAISSQIYIIPIAIRNVSPFDDCSTLGTAPCSNRISIEATPKPNDGLNTPQTIHELQFKKEHYETISRLFTILDTESRGLIDKKAVVEFVKQRCPVFHRRDLELSKFSKKESILGGKDGMGLWEVDQKLVQNRESKDNTPTFEEVWNIVVSCNYDNNADNNSDYLPSCNEDSFQQELKIGIEALMVFCRFIAFAQYQEATRRFAIRHLQQATHKAGTKKADDLVMVDIPPPDPTVLTVMELVKYELTETDSNGSGTMLFPELDLNHYLVLAHNDSCLNTNRFDTGGRGKVAKNRGLVKVCAFNLDKSIGNLEFIITTTSNSLCEHSFFEDTKVRRTYSDIEWLHSTFTSNKKLGGTLYGRILPPFPSKLHNNRTDYDEDEQSVNKSTTSAVKTVASATSGAIFSIKNSAQTLWNDSVSHLSHLPKNDGKSSSTPLRYGEGKYMNDFRLNRKIQSKSFCSEKDCIEENAYSKACQIEKYLNYLLDHPTLSTSFPLNVILKASQSGVDAAKKQMMIENSTNIRNQLQRRRHWYTTVNARGDVSLSQKRLSWVQSTAAQTALALKFHNLLEISGYQSSSARLQHASLPLFGSSSQSPWMSDDSNKNAVGLPLNNNNVGPERDREDKILSDNESEFESGVVCVESELDRESNNNFTDENGYDMLPEPLPIPERSALCAGSVNPRIKKEILPEKKVLEEKSNFDTLDKYQEESEMITNLDNASQGYHYGLQSRLTEYDSNAVLGDILVDSDIGKLKKLIISMDNALNRCLDMTVKISKLSRSRNLTHLGILTNLDSWEGFRGELFVQRTFLNGLPALDEGLRIADANAAMFSSGLSWLASLACCAVKAAEEVHFAVRTAKTSATAKATADFAAREAQENESNRNDAHTSNTQKHAIHAAVVEHEANTAKKQTVTAFASDMRGWNVHRKKALLQLGIKSAATHRNSAHQAAQGWAQLRDSLIDISDVSLLVEQRNIVKKGTKSTCLRNNMFLNNIETAQNISICVSHDEDQETEKIELPKNECNSSHNASDQVCNKDKKNKEKIDCSKRIDHNDESINNKIDERTKSVENGDDFGYLVSINDAVVDVTSNRLGKLKELRKKFYYDSFEDDLNIVRDFGVIVEDEPIECLKKKNSSAVDNFLTLMGNSETNSTRSFYDDASKTSAKPQTNPLPKDLDNEVRSSNIQETEEFIQNKKYHMENSYDSQSSSSTSSSTDDCENVGESKSSISNHGNMTESMQSLVDSLMSWGEQRDSQEDTEMSVSLSLFE